MEIILCSHKENVVVKSFQDHMWLIVPFNCKAGFISKIFNSVKMAFLKILSEVKPNDFKCSTKTN